MTEPLAAAARVLACWWDAAQDSGAPSFGAGAAAVIRAALEAVPCDCEPDDYGHWLGCQVVSALGLERVILDE